MGVCGGGGGVAFGENSERAAEQLASLLGNDRVRGIRVFCGDLIDAVSLARPKE